jgi:hypothetical protein
MSTEFMVVVIVAIVATACIRIARIANGTDYPRMRRRDRNAQALLQAAEPGPREIELQREVEELKERIHVLERIATDERRPRQLAAEI